MVADVLCHLLLLPERLSSQDPERHGALLSDVHLKHLSTEERFLINTLDMYLLYNMSISLDLVLESIRLIEGRTQLYLRLSVY